MTLELAHQERDRQREQDREWIMRIRAGDAAAFEHAFRAYHPILCVSLGPVSSPNTPVQGSGFDGS